MFWCWSDRKIRMLEELVEGAALLRRALQQPACRSVAPPHPRARPRRAPTPRTRTSVTTIHGEESGAA